MMMITSTTTAISVTVTITAAVILGPVTTFPVVDRLVLCYYYVYNIGYSRKDRSVSY